MRDVLWWLLCCSIVVVVSQQPTINFGQFTFPPLPPLPTLPPLPPIPGITPTTSSADLARQVANLLRQQFPQVDSFFNTTFNGTNFNNTFDQAFSSGGVLAHFFENFDFFGTGTIDVIRSLDFNYRESNWPLSVFEPFSAIFTADIEITGDDGDATFVLDELEGEAQIWLNDTLLFDQWAYPASPELDIALGKPATQSSVSWSANAGRAVDGNVNGIFSAHSVSRTAFELHPWWEVDLEGNYTLTRVTIYNRIDCCQELLEQTSLLLLNNERETVFTYPLPFIQYSLGVAIPNVDARYVRLEQAGSGYIALAEVAVAGYLVGAPRPPLETKKIRVTAGRHRLTVAIHSGLDACQLRLLAPATAGGTPDVVGRLATPVTSTGLFATYAFTDYYKRIYVIPSPKADPPLSTHVTSPTFLGSQTVKRVLYSMDLVAPDTAKYEFYFTTRNAGRIWVDGTLHLSADQSIPGELASGSFFLDLSANEQYNFQIDVVFETAPDSPKLDLKWRKTGGGSIETVPASVFRAHGIHGLFGTIEDLFDNENAPASSSVQFITPAVAWLVRGTSRPPLRSSKYRMLWTGFLYSDFTEDFSIYMKGEAPGPFTITLDNVVVTEKDKVSLVAGKPYPIQISMEENDNTIDGDLYWSSASVPPQLIDQRNLLPDACGVVGRLEVRQTFAGHLDVFCACPLDRQVPGSLHCLSSRPSTCTPELVLPKSDCPSAQVLADDFYYRVADEGDPPCRMLSLHSLDVAKISLTFQVSCEFQDKIVPSANYSQFSYFVLDGEKFASSSPIQLNMTVRAFSFTELSDASQSYTVEVPYSVFAGGNFTIDLSLPDLQDHHLAGGRLYLEAGLGGMVASQSIDLSEVQRLFFDDVNLQRGTLVLPEPSSVGVVVVVLILLLIAFTICICFVRRYLKAQKLKAM